MLSKISKVNFNKNGFGYINARLILPKEFVNKIGIDENNRNVKIICENNKIIIERV